MWRSKKAVNLTPLCLQIKKKTKTNMDSIETVKLNNVEVQTNGIIRNSRGHLIGRLVDGVDYNGEHIKFLSHSQIEKFKKVILLLRNAQDYTEHDEEIVSLISKFIGLELPTPENYPEGKELFTPIKKIK